MAHIHPHGWRELAADTASGQETVSLALQRELATLGRFAETLPDSITIYHGVHWTHLSGPHTVIDDIDFVLIGPSGKILLIEQASGFLSETPQGLARRRPGSDGALPLASTLAHSVATLSGRLRRAMSDGNDKSSSPDIDALLYCPDYTVRNAGTAGLPPERIVDASQREQLPKLVGELLGLNEKPDAEAGDVQPQLPAATLARLHRFFADLLQLAPEANAIVGEVQGLTTRLSGGLAT